MCINDCCCCDKGDGQTLTKRNVCCTDILFLILFVGFWGGMVYIAVFTVQEGDAWRLMYGYDSFGNTCNENNSNKETADFTELSGRNTLGLKKVFFLDVLDPDESMELCVQECPKVTLDTKEKVQQFSKETNSLMCRYDIDIEDYLKPGINWGKKGPCPQLPVLASISLLSRCMPNLIELIGGDTGESTVNASDVGNIIDFLNNSDIFQQVLSDLYTSWKELIYLCLIAFGLSFTMVILIRYVASVLVWVVVVLAAAASILGTGILWWTWYELKYTKRHEMTGDWDLPIINMNVKNEQCFMWFSIIATVCTFFLLLVILVMRSRLALVVTLFHEAGKCLVNMPLMLIQPLWTFAVLIVFIVYWLIVLAFIATQGDPYPTDEKGFTDGIMSVEFNTTSTQSAFFWYHLVGLIWTAEFILACQQFVISAAVSSWFFSRERGALNCTLTKSVARLTFHHIGTVAFGAFIITLVKLPRYILMYIQSKCDGSEGLLAKACLKCCICCLWCLEKMLKFLNQNAYTITAIEGKSFCPAAKRAFGIIASNVLRVAAINSVGAFVLFLGKVGVMAATCAISVVWLKSNEDLHFFAIPVLLVTLIAYLIADCFLTIYEMVIDTLLLCFCEDCELNDGSEDKPYFMSNSLMEFVNNSKAAKNTSKKANGGKVDSLEMDDK